MPNSKPLLHLVAFDVPEPPDYGGVIDIYYKIRALKQCGISVILHAFEYGKRARTEALHHLCEQVYLYKRRTFKNPFYGEIPYITGSRDSAELLEHLANTEAPILFEGLHSCYWLDHPSLANRFKVVRTHNIEHDYYANLEAAETNFFKKYFFRVEAERLRHFEPILKKANLIAAISPDDTGYFSRLYGHTEYIPAFHPNEQVDISSGKGSFALYHGNLAVAENNQGALYLVREVFSKVQAPCVIAGNQPSAQLKQAVSRFSHIQLAEGLDSEAVLRLIGAAQVNVLCTFQGTGIKLKLINALYRGRHCLTNSVMVHHTGLEPLCRVADHPQEMASCIMELMDKTFTESDIASRREALQHDFNNHSNAERLIQVMQKAHAWG
jgi:hypothetical protein